MLRVLFEEAPLYKGGRCAGGAAPVIREEGALEEADRRPMEDGNQRTHGRG